MGCQFLEIADRVIHEMKTRPKQISRVDVIDEIGREMAKTIRTEMPDQSKNVIQSSRLWNLGENSIVLNLKVFVSTLYGDSIIQSEINDGYQFNFFLTM